MSAQERSGLVDRRKADILAASVFFLVLISFFIFLAGALSEHLPSKQITTKYTTQVTSDAKGNKQHTVATIEKTTTDVLPSVWERLLGNRVSFVSTVALSLLGAFVAAGAVQRVLLGQYAFTIGPLTVPEVTAKEVRDAAASVLSYAPEGSTAEALEQTSQAIWTTFDDPALAFAGWRIDLEQELQRLAQANGLPVTGDGESAQLIRTLIDGNILDPDTASGLQKLLSLANRAVHGAAVDPAALEVLRTQGSEILSYIRTLHHR